MQYPKTPYREKQGRVTKDLRGWGKKEKRARGYALRPSCNTGLRTYVDSEAVDDMMNVCRAS